MGSAGRASGGGGSTNDYPEYQKVIQANWLAGGDYDKPSSLATLDDGRSITALLNVALANSPYEEATAYDPSTHTTAMLNAVNSYLARLDKEIDAYLTYVDQYVTQLKTDDAIVDAETLASETDPDTFVSTYEQDGSLGMLAFLGDDIKDSVSLDGTTDLSSTANPDLYYVDGSLDEALAYVRRMDTTEGVENELSQFDAQMRDINSLHSSAFTVGRSVVASGLLGAKAQLHADLGKAKSDKMLRYVQLQADIEVKDAEIKSRVADINAKAAEIQLRVGELRDAKARTILQASLEGFVSKMKMLLGLGQEKININQILTSAHERVFGTTADAVQSRAKLSIEAQRMALIAFKEETDENLRIDVKDSSWSVDMFQGAANVMASIAGGTVTSTEEPSNRTSSIAGALSGAASGAMLGAQTGTPHGALIGGAIGGIGGLLAG